MVGDLGLSFTAETSDIDLVIVVVAGQLSVLYITVARIA